MLNPKDNKITFGKHQKTISSAKNIIGVFDSGLGGLTVLKYFLQELPDYNYIYLGDNARLPYGEKSPETIYQYSLEAVDHLFKAGCNLIITACNTVSTQALRRLQQEYLPANYPDRRILGVIRPIVEKIASDSKIGSVGVIGTKATVNSNAYEIELKKLKADLEIEQRATPLLVPLIEEDWSDKPETKMILKKYLRPLKMKKVDALILGCTHYPFLYKEAKNIMGRRVSVPHPGIIIADSLKNYLKRHEELGLHPVAEPEHRYFTTDNPSLFKKLAEKFLGHKIPNLEQIKISHS